MGRGSVHQRISPSVVLAFMFVLLCHRARGKLSPTVGTNPDLGFARASSWLTRTGSSTRARTNPNPTCHAHDSDYPCDFTGRFHAFGPTRSHES